MLESKYSCIVTAFEVPPVVCCSWAIKRNSIKYYIHCRASPVHYTCGTETVSSIWPIANNECKGKRWLRALFLSSQPRYSVRVFVTNSTLVALNTLIVLIDRTPHHWSSLIWTPALLVPMFLKIRNFQVILYSNTPLVCGLNWRKLKC